MSIRGGFLAAAFLSLIGLTLLTGCPSTGGTGDPSVQAGQTKFSQSCNGCHTAASLSGSANLIINNLGSLNASMSGLILTDEEVANVKAYLATQ